MSRLIVFVFFALFLSGNGKQNLYKFIPEYGKVIYTNTEYLEIYNWSFKKYNKTTGAFNLDFTLKKDIDENLSDHITGFMFKNNEFKKTAFEFDVKICQLFQQLHSFDIEHLLQNSNLTLKCPLKKGTYYAHDLVPDAENFPPLFPAGRWLFKQEFKLKGTPLTTFDLIWRVEY